MQSIAYFDFLKFLKRNYPGAQDSIKYNQCNHCKNIPKYKVEVCIYLDTLQVASPKMNNES